MTCKWDVGRKRKKKEANTRFKQQADKGLLTTLVYFLSWDISFVSRELFQDFVKFLLTNTLSALS